MSSPELGTSGGLLGGGSAGEPVWLEGGILPARLQHLPRLSTCPLGLRSWGGSGSTQRGMGGVLASLRVKGDAPHVWAQALGVWDSELGREGYPGSQ